MEVVNQGSSVTVRLRLKDTHTWVNFESVSNIEVVLLNNNMNVKKTLRQGEDFTVHGDVLTLLLNKTLTARTGKYQALLSFEKDGKSLSFSPYLFSVVRTAEPSHFHDGNTSLEYEVVFGNGVDSEGDPIFQQSPAATIRSEDIDEWNNPPKYLTDSDIDNICV